MGRTAELSSFFSFVPLNPCFRMGFISCESKIILSLLCSKVYNLYIHEKNHFRNGTF